MPTEPKSRVRRPNGFRDKEQAEVAELERLRTLEAELRMYCRLGIAIWGEKEKRDDGGLPVADNRISGNVSEVYADGQVAALQAVQRLFVVTEQS